jgi:hypothetical protein
VPGTINGQPGDSNKYGIGQRIAMGDPVLA